MRHRQTNNLFLDVQYERNTTPKYATSLRYLGNHSAISPISTRWRLRPTSHQMHRTPKFPSPFRTSSKTGIPTVLQDPKKPKSHTISAHTPPLLQIGSARGPSDYGLTLDSQAALPACPAFNPADPTYTAGTRPFFRGLDRRLICQTGVGEQERGRDHLEICSSDGARSQVGKGR